MSHEAICCSNLSPRLFAAICRIVCLGLEGRDTLGKSLRQVAATGCCNKSPCVTCENHCRCDRILSLRSVARIQIGLNSCHIFQRQKSASSLVAACVRIYEKSQRQNLNQPMREHQLASHHVKFELVYISSSKIDLRAPNNCLIAATYRNISADEVTFRRDESQRFIESCVSALKLTALHGSHWLFLSIYVTDIFRIIPWSTKYNV